VEEKANQEEVVQENSMADEDTLNKGDYNVQNIVGDGWCLYRSMIRGYAILKDPSANDIKDWYKYENNKIKEIMPELIKKMKESLDDTYIASLSSNLNSNSTFRDYIADYIKQKPDETQNVKTVDEYINSLNIYLNDNFTDGPLIWGDALISGYIYSKMNNVILNTYQDCSGAKEIANCANKYKLFASSKEYIDKSITDHIDILYIGSIHYNLLVKKSIQNGGKKVLKARLYK
jgi:hypothetical protein